VVRKYTKAFSLEDMFSWLQSLLAVQYLMKMQDVERYSVSNHTSLFLPEENHLLRSSPHNVAIMSSGLHGNGPLPAGEFNLSPSHVYEPLNDLLNPQPYESPCKCQLGDKEQAI